MVAGAAAEAMAKAAHRSPFSTCSFRIDCTPDVQQTRPRADGARLSESFRQHVQLS